MKCNTREAFLALVRAGLWEKEVCLSSCGNIDYERLNLLSQEQAVDGLIAGYEIRYNLYNPRTDNGSGWMRVVDRPQQVPAGD